MTESGEKANSTPQKTDSAPQNSKNNSILNAPSLRLIIIWKMKQEKRIVA